MLRLRDHRRPPAGSDDDLIRECYASPEFKEGVDGVPRRPPTALVNPLIAC